jgi:hemerythrin
MSSLADLHREHRELITLASTVCSGEPQGAVQAERARRGFATLHHRLTRHLAAEAPTLAALADAPEGSATRIAGQARAREAGALTEACAGFASRWGTAGSIERDGRGFLSTWEILHGALDRLIAREEAEVYPLATSLWEPRPLPAPTPTGILALDEDHAEVFALIGGLRAAVGGGQHHAEGQLITELVGYTERHFTLEERMMEASGFPGLDDHRQEHHHARTIVTHFRNDHLDGRAVEAKAVLDFLEGWLLSHIAYNDQAMAAFLLRPT